MNQYLARLKTHLKNEAAQQTDITDRRSFVSSVRTHTIHFSPSNRIVGRGVSAEAEGLKRQQIADEKNRRSECLNNTDRFCSCGVLATLEWPHPAKFRRVWRCEACGPP